LHSEQSSNIDQILGEATALERNLILIRKMAAAGTDMSNNLGVDGNKQGGTEVRNGLVTPQATPAVEDGRIDADKARQAAVAAAVAETSANG